MHDDLRAWNLHRLLWVGDAGLTSKDNRTYLQRAGGQVLFAEKLRHGNDNHAALARQGRYQIVDDNLHVKQVHVGDATAARRFVVCRNLAEATRDTARRDKALARLRDELAAIDAKTGDTRLAAEGELLANPTLRRYLTRRNTRLVIDTAKVTAERRLDGKFLLSCTDPTIPAADLARLYKSLLDVERCWRDLKQIIDIRPVYHRKDDRIRGTAMLRMLQVQQGRCPLCQGLLLHADHEPQSPCEWEQWLTATRKATRKHAVIAWGEGTPDERVATRLIHAHCHRRLTSGGTGTASQRTRGTTGLA